METTDTVRAEAENYVRDCLRIFGQAADQPTIDRAVDKLVKITQRYAASGKFR
jgi:hypothetical protein